MPGTCWSGHGKPANGETVRAVAEKALGKQLAKELFKDHLSTAVVEGEVVDNTDARKISIRWTHPGGLKDGTHSSRVLIGGQKHASDGGGVENNDLGEQRRGTEAELCTEEGDVIVEDDPEESPTLEVPLPADIDPSLGPQVQDLLKPHDQVWRENEHGVPVCWRAGDGRAGVADSAFASVPTAVLLYAEYGLYFTGLIKTAHKFFPLKYLQQRAMTSRGETFTLTAERNGVKLHATVWNDPCKPGKPRKYILSTCGSTVTGKACERQRKKVSKISGAMEDVTLVVPRSKVVQHYFTHAGAIDKQNRVRQDGFRMERNVEVKKWRSMCGYPCWVSWQRMRLLHGN